MGRHLATETSSRTKPYIERPHTTIVIPFDSAWVLHMGRVFGDKEGSPAQGG